MFKNITISERLRNVIIAVALAAFAGMLTLFYVSRYKENVQQSEESVSVLVALKEIPPGTPGDEALKDKLVAPREVEQNAVVPGSFTEPEQIEKLLTTDRIYAGEQITASRFRPEIQKGPRAELKGTMRAVQVPGTVDQLLVGTITEGDHVDVVANFEFKARQTDRAATRVILRDILVLKAPEGDSLASFTESGEDETSVQLALTDSQSQKLFFAMRNGEWTLALRPPVRSADSPESVEVLETILGDGLSPKQYAQLYGGGFIR